MKDPQQASLLELCQNGIGVYSPHTSVDGAEGGVNDFLVDVVSSVDIQGVYIQESKPIIPLKAPVPGMMSLQMEGLRSRSYDGRIRTNSNVDKTSPLQRYPAEIKS